MSFIAETVFLGGILLIWLLTRIIDFRKLFFALQLPGPVPLPVLGNGLLFLNKSPAGNGPFCSFKSRMYAKSNFKFYYQII